MKLVGSWFKTKEVVSLQTHSWTGELLSTRYAMTLGTFREWLDKLMDKKNSGAQK